MYAGCPISRVLSSGKWLYGPKLRKHQGKMYSENVLSINTETTKKKQMLC